MTATSICWTTSRGIYINEKNGRPTLKGKQRVLSGLEQRTANKMRTAPLWGLRVRPQLMHDGLSLTIEEAIRRHGGQAEGVRLTYFRCFA